LYLFQGPFIKSIGQPYTGSATNNRSIDAATFLANKGGTALPICRAISILLPLNLKESGND
jgi:hypothetical protein